MQEEATKMLETVGSNTEATSLDWKISVFGKSQCSATACWWDIENRVRKKQCWSYLRQQVTIFVYKCFVYDLPIFLLGKPWLNIGICPTLGFSILKMSPQSMLGGRGNFLMWNFLRIFLDLFHAKSHVGECSLLFWTRSGRQRIHISDTFSTVIMSL
jgi:hypothetical protein